MNPTTRFGNDDETKARSLLPWLWTPVALSLLATLAFASNSFANTIYVTSLEDKISSSGGCSLKEAIYASNLQQNTAVSGYASDGTPQTVTTQCNPGSGNDTIILPTNGLLQLSVITDDAGNYVGPAATPVVTAANVLIEANGATLQRVGSANMRLFVIGPTTHLTIDNAHIKDFVAHGGNGNGGGGGGMGAGGVVFVDSGALIIENSTIEENSAVGGNGSSYTTEYSGGGGGGIGGNGGVGSFFGAGGGGGGSRGAGAAGSVFFLFPGEEVGGGGGGTVFDAILTTSFGIGSGGFACGGDGSGPGEDASSASCNGGGGGGGASAPANPGGCVPILGIQAGQGGNGNFGGGGGGGGNCGNEAGVDAGSGGFGGGGGAGGGSGNVTDTNGGSGGFGGGAGVSPDNPGNKGMFGGSASHSNSGGGAGLGGAVFNNEGSVVIQNSTFTGNDAVGGRKGDASDTVAGTGEGHGGVIFALNGSTRVLNVTIDGNLTSGSGAGIYIYQSRDTFGLPTDAATFVLRNTILADSNATDCVMNALVITGGDWRGNLIQNDDTNFPCDYASPQPSGIVSTADPLLGPLQNNQGFTPTMAITERSPAWNAADAATSLTTDQRGEGRPSNGGFDIGAFELCLTGLAPVQRPCIISGGLEGGEGESFEDLTIQVSSPAAGTTTPAPGTYGPQIDTVAVVSATANPGYSFLNWTGNVADPTNPTTTVIMDQPQTITANFSPCACAGDVSASVTVTRGPFVFNLGTGRFYETVTLTNNSTSTVSGPLSLVLDGLTSGAILFNATSTTDSLEPPAGNPYINVTAANLAPGQTTSIQLQFTDPTRAAITYTTRVLAGPGSR